MRTLIEKEIRLLLPAFAAALALAILPVWLLPAGGFEPWGNGPSGSACLYSLGTVLLVLSSYGREISLKTLPFMLAQPLDRARIWWIKFAVLVVLMGLAFYAWWLSATLCFVFQPARLVPREILVNSGLAVAVLAAGGLWTTLLLRQIAGAFWLTVLIPMAPIVAIQALGGAAWMAYVALGLYSVAAFFLARRQFLHIQDTAWTGGVLSLGRARAAKEGSALREHRPWVAPFWKEVQLQQVTLLGMGCLLALHLGVVALRKAGAQSFGRTTLDVLEGFGWLWLFVPLLAGSQGVAEERKLGTMQAHLCLPVSRRGQWLMKLMVALVIGGLLSGALFWAVEHVAGILHMAHTGDVSYGWFLMFLALALAGFYGSTLTSGVLQALGAVALMVAGLWGSLIAVAAFFSYSLVLRNRLPPYIVCPALLVTLLWLAYRNFGTVSENWRLWRRNALALAGMLALSLGLTAAILNRAWEWLTPLEQPHGPARMSLEKPPVLHSYGGWGMAALLPDGRLWVDRLHYDWRRVYHGFYCGGRWMSVGGNQLLRGSNWVDAVANSRETVAIRSDGTLWVSERPRKLQDGQGATLMADSAGLVQFGHEANWQNVVLGPSAGMVLLKRDGTLWDWGTNDSNSKHEWPSLRDLEPRRLGRDSDWAGLLGVSRWIYACAWKKDGSAWGLFEPDARDSTALKDAEQELAPGIALARVRGLDHSRWRGLISGGAAFAGVREDGTLWFWDTTKNWKTSQQASTIPVPFDGSAPVRIGNDSDWAEIAGSVNSFSGLVARKTDGSLWKWDWNRHTEFNDPLAPLRRPLVRLGTHSDWVAIGDIGGEIFSLAADGNLWSWPDGSPAMIGFGTNSDEDSESSLFIAASRKPSRIENIFGAQ